jgi:hypothetical protein
MIFRRLTVQLAFLAFLAYVLAIAYYSLGLKKEVTNAILEYIKKIFSIKWHANRSYS